MDSSEGIQTSVQIKRNLDVIQGAMTKNYESVTKREYCHLTWFLDDGIHLSTYGSFVTTILLDKVLDMCYCLQYEFVVVTYVESIEYKYCGNKPKKNRLDIQKPRENVTGVTV